VRKGGFIAPRKNLYSRKVKESVNGGILGIQARGGEGERLETGPKVVAEQGNADAKKKGKGKVKKVSNRGQKYSGIKGTSGPLNISSKSMTGRKKRGDHFFNTKGIKRTSVLQKRTQDLRADRCEEKR